MAQTVKTLGPSVTLDGFSLKQALESIYSTFSSVLAGRGETDSQDLYRKEIPGMVFDAAVGAGWIPFGEGVDVTEEMLQGHVAWQAGFRITAKTNLPQWIRDHVTDQKKKGNGPPPPTEYTKNQAQRLVQFGEWIVDRIYLEQFLALLEETIAFHVAEGTKHDENLKRLPKRTSTEQRQTFLQQYIAQAEAAGTPVTLKDIARRADVDYSVLMKWKKKTSPLNDDSVPPAQRIMCLLLFDEIGRKRHYYRAHTK